MVTPDHIMIDRRILLEAHSLMSAGHDVKLFAGWSAGFPEYEEDNGLEIHRLNWDGDDDRLKKVIHRVPGKLRGAFVKGFVVWRKLLATMTAYEYFLWKNLVSVDADVYHAHDLPVLKPAYFAARHHGARLVYDAHELYPHQVSFSKKQVKRWRKLESKFIGRADVVITVNDFLADFLAREYCIAAPRVIHNCTKPPEGFVPGGQDRIREVAGISRNTKIVLYQGWIAEHRNLENLIESAIYFPSHVVLVMIGYGYYLDSLKELARGLGVEHKVYFLGGVPNEEIVWYAASADLGVMPYVEYDLNSRWSSPNKFFEYVVAGLPVLASHLPFYEKVIHEYGLGETANFASPRQIAEAVTGMLESPEKLAAYRRAAIKASRVLNWENEAQKLVEIYSGLEDQKGITRGR